MMRLRSGCNRLCRRVGRGRRAWWRLGPALLTLLALTLAACGGHVLPEIHSQGDRLATARALYDRGSYGDASELLKNIIDSGAGSARIDEAIYLLGQCYLTLHEWSMATEQFERIARDYPESDSSGSAAFRLGEAYYGQSRKPDFDQDRTRQALEQWSGYLRAYPGHWLNVEAQKRIMQARTRLAQKALGTGDLYLKMRLMEPARAYYQVVIDEFGDTSWRPRAELGLAMVDAKEGRKAEAIERLREIERQYPQLPIAQLAGYQRRKLERK